MKSPRRPLRFPILLAAALGWGAAAGAAVGLVEAWRFVAAGYPLLLAEAVRWEVLWGLAAGAAFALLFHLGARWPGRHLRPIPAAFAAAALAAIPLVAAGGYRLNRSLGVRPPELLESYALKHNLAYLGLCLVLYLAVTLTLVLLHRRQGEPSRGGRSGWLVASGLLAGAALLHLGVGALLARGPGGDPPPDVIVLLVDALRADRLGAAGYHRPTTPAIDSLARDGVLFSQAVSHSTFTKSAVASLFTGRSAYRHGVYWGSHRESPHAITSDVLDPGEVTLAEALRDQGYLTVAWVQNSHLRAFMGFGQGFVDYRDQQGDIDRIHRRFRRFLRGPGQRYPFFAYLHYIDLHDPYLPEPPYDTLFGRHSDVYAGIDFARWGAYLESLRTGERTLSADDVAQLEAFYDGQLRAIDDRIARLLDHLKRSGRYDRSLIVLTSDHGDAFMEHGFISHSTTPYEELVRVPLVMKLPGGRHAGARIDRQVRLIDLFPTLLEAVGAAEVPETVEGCSLLPLLDDPSPPGWEERCGEAMIEIAEEGAYPVVAIRTGRYKYIHHQDRPDELYDLLADPEERHPLDPAALPAGQALRERALEVVALRRELPGERIELDPRTIRELKALGYIE